MRVVLETYALCAPTDEAVRRWQQMMDECIGNLPAAERNGFTPWEASLARMPRSTLQALTGRLVDAYRCSGGLLSALVDRPTEADDDVWRALAGRPDADAVWNDTPSPLFANLTPAEVWAGGGPEELRLARQFMTAFSAEARNRRGSVADHIQHALLSLRHWQRLPTADGRTPSQIIHEERRHILARKRQIIAGLLQRSIAAG